MENSISEADKVDSTGDDTARARDADRPRRTTLRDERSEQAKRDDTRKPAADTAPPDDKNKPGIIRSHPIAFLIAGLVALAVIVAGILWWLNARHFESTDDAYIDTRSVPTGPQVSGMITALAVTDNQPVDKGQLLFTIDERDYRASRDQAQAQVAEAQATVSIYDAQIEAQQAQIEQAAKQVTEAQAALSFSQDENTRYQDLVRSGAGTTQRAQQAASDLRQKQAALASAEAAQAGTERQIAVLQAQRKSAQAKVDEAQAQLDQANVALSRTRVISPDGGRVTKLSAAQGAYATTGQVLLTLVPSNVWVTANFKETQLTDMRPGQHVDLSIDAYPGRKFSAHVDSVQAGSGTAFSLLPAENATGNFVKVVQRVPVKIVFDTPPDVPLGPGMSVTPSVKVR